MTQQTKVDFNTIGTQFYVAKNFIYRNGSDSMVIGTEKNNLCACKFGNQEYFQNFLVFIYVTFHSFQSCFLVFHPSKPKFISEFGCLIQKFNIWENTDPCLSIKSTFLWDASLNNMYWIIYNVFIMFCSQVYHLPTACEVVFFPIYSFEYIVCYFEYQCDCSHDEQL